MEGDTLIVDGLPLHRESRCHGLPKTDLGENLMHAAHLHQALLDAGIWPDEVTRMEPNVYVRISKALPRGNGTRPVVITQGITICTRDMSITTSHSGWSGPIDAEQARALALLAERYADALEIVEQVVGSNIPTGA